ncbi:MAG: hypothetical protein HOV79_23395 [Hamadaea sp.]|nr:hypothetical protein [Hamadaea sp.]
MSATRPLPLRRRMLLGVPALVAAAVTVVKPGKAHAKPKTVECLADLQEA